MTAAGARTAAISPVVARTATLTVAKPYEGWEFTIRLDFPARVLERLASGDVVEVCRALDSLIVEHNFPDVDGQVAASMLDVFPLEGVIAALDAYTRHRTTVPNP